MSLNEVIKISDTMDSFCERSQNFKFKNKFSEAGSLYHMKLN